jgi:hypothetical protein
MSPQTISSVTSTDLVVLHSRFARLYGSYAHGAFMSTLAEISGIPFLLCLILGVAKHFVAQFGAREWSAHLPDFIELMVMWAVYVWLSNLFGNRVTCLDESDAINLLSIFLVCLSVVLFRGKDDHTFHP